MSARPDASLQAAPPPEVRALAGDDEFAMFEIVEARGDLLVVWTKFQLAIGEEISLELSTTGRTIGRVCGHRTEGGRQLHELRLGTS